MYKFIHDYCNDLDSFSSVFFNLFSHLNACKTIKLPYIIKREPESNLTTWFRIDKSRSYLTPCTNDWFTVDTCIRKIMLLKLNYISSHRKVLENLINYFNEQNKHLQLLFFCSMARVSSSEDHPCQLFLIEGQQSLSRMALLDHSTIFNKCPDVLLWYFMQGLMGHSWVYQQNKISFLHV